MKKWSGPADVAVDNCQTMAGENCLSPVQEFICFNLQRIFFMVKKSEKPSHFQECFGSPGISDISLSSLSFVSVKGLQHFLVTWSMIRRFISGESWFKKFLLVIKITIINSDFKIFSLKSFPTRLERPDSRRQGNWTYMSTWTNFLFQRDLGEWRVTSTDSKRDSWTILFCVMNFQQLHCFQNVRNVFEWLWFGFDRTWSLHWSIYPRRKSPVFISIFVS